MNSKMPATIAPIDVTRTCSVKPAQGLRYGNFEGIRHLPPVRHSEKISEHNLWSLNNEQIYKTVCQWMETWQPWQQRTVLCGVANRCTISQLEILSTTLEPLRHRDYKTISLSRYPSAPFKVKESSLQPVQKKQTLKEKSTPKHCDPSIPLIITDDFGNIAGIKEITAAADKKSKPTERKIEGETDQNNNRPQMMVKKSAERNSEGEQKAVAEYVGKVMVNEGETSRTTMDVSNYVSILSSSILISALNDAATLSHYDQNQFSASRENSHVSNSKVKILEPENDQNLEGKNACSVNQISRESTRQCLESSSEIRGIRSAASGQKSRPLTQSSRMSSAKFLGGTLEFVSDPFNKGQLRQRSSSSRFRYSAFASSVASTTDYFNRKKLAVLGPMQHLMRSGSVSKPLRLGPLPVSLQKYHKNSKWWPVEPPPGKVFHQAKKQELATNFKEQLMTIWNWLSEWESHERISFIKEIAKMCSADVLDALLTHIQQSLRDARDINRLPDKLLLYIFSFLSPYDIIQCSKVSRRWRYLCAMDELWILKCLEVGEREGVSNMTELVQQANSKGMSIDWMMAYSQLNKLMETLKGDVTVGGNICDGVLGSKGPPGDKKRPVDRIWTGFIKPTAGDLSEPIVTPPDAKKRQGKGSVRIKLNTGIREKLEMRNTQKNEKRAKKRGSEDLSDTDSAFSEEDLSPFIDEYNMLLKEEPEKSDPQWSRPPQKSESNKMALYETVEEGTTPSAGSDGRNMSSKPSRSKKKEEEKDTALDIRTDLTQSHDILGKMVSRKNLEWETADTYNDYMRTTLYAGEVTSVKRMRRLQGHVNCINCLWFDNRRLVTCGLDRVVRLWDVRSGRSLQKFLGHKGGIRCVQFDNNIMATGSWDCLILIWDMRNFINLATLQGHNDSVTCLEFNDDILISGSDDRTVRLWRRHTFSCMMTIPFNAPVLSLVIVDHMFVVSTSDLKLQMLDVYTGTLRRKFEAPLGPTNSLLVHGQLMMGGDAAGRVSFWNLETGEMEAAVKVHDHAVNKLAYHNGRFFTASSDTTIKEWDLMTMTCLRVLKGHRGPVRDVKVSERRIISCGDDATTRIWDLVLNTNKLTTEEEAANENY